ncbi:MAG: flagellar biosynthesis anti-sigma factor FlgM [Myxococcota bacterium]
MRINGKDPNPRAAPSSRAQKTQRTGTTGKAQGTAKRGDNGPSSGVSAKLSPEAIELAEQGGVDAAKVERLRGIIERGEFVINSQLIAERILQTGG